MSPERRAAVDRMRARICDLWWQMSIRDMASELDVTAQCITATAVALDLPQRPISAPPPGVVRDVPGDGT
jgi:hypothetical protein